MPRPSDDRLMWEAHKKTQKELIDEGILDRMRANKAARKAGPSISKRIGQTAKAVGSGIAQGFGGSGKGLQQVQKDRQSQAGDQINAKANSIIMSYTQKIEQLAGGIKNDLNKIGFKDTQALMATNQEAGAALQELKSAITRVLNSVSASTKSGTPGQVYKKAAQIPGQVQNAPIPATAPQASQPAPAGPPPIK